MLKDIQYLEEQAEIYQAQGQYRLARIYREEAAQKRKDMWVGPVLSLTYMLDVLGPEGEEFGEEYNMAYQIMLDEYKYEEGHP